MSGTSEYRTWAAMLQRCGNEKNPAWQGYGARGIKVTPRWVFFKHFYTDMGPRPEGMSLDRIDVNQGYRKSNCRWATPTEQASNRRPSSEWKFEDEEEFY